MQHSLGPRRGKLSPHDEIVGQEAGLQSLGSGGGLAHWLWHKIKPALPELTRVIVHETCDARCEYEGE